MEENYVFNVCLFFTGLAGGLNKQIWHVKWVSNVARSLYERPSTERPDHRCTYQVRPPFPQSNILRLVCCVRWCDADPGFCPPPLCSQALWPVLRVPHIAHGKEVLPSSHRDGSPVSREPHWRGAEERGQEWSQKRRTVHDNQVSEESGFSRTGAGGDREEFRDF